MSDENNDLIQVATSRILPAKRWKVFRFITRMQHYQQYMPSVKQCTVLERFPNGAITCWSVEVDGIPMGWKERDEFDLANFSIHFKALEGDLERFEGRWTLKDHNDGTEVMVEVRAKLGIPLVTKLLEEAVRDKLKKNFDLMLSAMEKTLVMQRYRNIRDRRSGLKGFGVIGHPYNFQHLVRYFKFFKPDLKLPSQEFLSKIFDLTPSYKGYDIKDFTSRTGKKVDGCFIMCPIIPDMLTLNPDRVIEKVIQACRVAEQHSIGIVVLGGFTSIAGEKFSQELVSATYVPMTTGNTLTVSLVLDGIHKAAELMELDLSQANVVIIGGTGDIGGTVARVLSEKVRTLTITSRSEHNLMAAERILFYYGKAEVKMTRDNNEAIKNADIVLAAASVPHSIINFNNFKPGAIICDVGYPKNISYTNCRRDDIFIFSGGITALPSEFNLGFDVGLPTAKVLYGCFAEAILLALEDRYENFSWGKGNIGEEKIKYIREAAQRHGFELAPFFWGNRLMNESDIRQIKKNVKVIS